MSAADPTPPCVLIAEGDPWVREMLSEMLLSVRCDARLQVCADGSQALTALASSRLLSKATARRRVLLMSRLHQK